MLDLIANRMTSTAVALAEVTIDTVIKTLLRIKGVTSVYLVMSKFMRAVCSIVVLVLVLNTFVYAQPLVKNPSAVAFNCPDHASDDQHELDIIRVSDGVVVQTLLGGDPPLNAAGEVEITVNVQPVSFGQYRFVARAVAGALKSNDSLPSAVWERAPGPPSNVTVR